MKLENGVIREGVLGKERYFILCSERWMGNKNKSIYLMDTMGEESNYFLWFGEIVDDEGTIDFWPYKGPNYEIIMKELKEYFVEHGMDDYSEGENQRQQGEAALKAGEYVKAAEHFNKVADHSIDAQYNLGLLYYNGWGVPQDYAKAAEWFRKAAEQGHDEAKDYLAKMESEQRK
jgi:tetratricopeptide (TPR) repeat protein